MQTEIRAANWKSYCISGGSGPTSSTPGVVRILSGDDDTELEFALGDKL